jgi:integrative and conjugative element protein (TIGR02256 family)
MIKPLKYQRLHGGLFELSLAACETISRYQQNVSSSTEAGGIILGNIFLDTLNVTANFATEPCVTDHRTRFSFFRARAPTQSIIDRTWRQSDGTQNYLGEWHTHPEPIPHPSEIDINNWKRIVKKSIFQQAGLFFIIAGTEKIHIWEVTKENLSIHPLQCLDQQ